MNRSAPYATAIVLLHLLVNVVHGLAHRRLAVHLTSGSELFVIVVILLCPLLSAWLVWTTKRPFGLLLLFLSMMGSGLFGFAHHFLTSSPDHVRWQPTGPWGLTFVLTAYALLMTEAIGAYLGLHFLSIANGSWNKMRILPPTKKKQTQAAGGPASAVFFRPANFEDSEALVCLINVAFRVEQPFIEGERIHQEGVRAHLEKGKFLVAEDSAGLVGCVYVELRGDRGYLGLLGVHPRRQGTGLGRKLMGEAEEYFRQAGCRAIDLRIISPRTALPAFYKHLGYTETGTAPFAPAVPSKVAGHYILMSKSLA